MDPLSSRARAAALLLAAGLAAPAEARATTATGEAVAPAAVATGGRLEVGARGLPRPVRIEERVGDAWRARGEPILAPGAATAFRAPRAPGALRLRARGVDGSASASVFVRVRDVVLAAVGDVNLGDGPGAAIARLGASWPWRSVGPRLRAADVAVANLECAISVRGAAQPKQYVFRGRPSSLAAAGRAGGLDVVSLANNHAGDFGRTALLDTIRHARAAGIVPVGAGASERSAYAPRVVEVLGARIAFVGFSEVLPFEFRAVGRRPGTAWAFPERIRASVRAARREADAVVAMLHWGLELDRSPTARQRELAQVALDAGATVVLGHHPHVLQPVRRPAPGRLVAFSLGNFVFGAGSPGTSRTGILEVRLRAGRVRGHRLVPARIVGSRPVLAR